jgi:hypothetical protein
MARSTGVQCQRSGDLDHPLMAERQRIGACIHVPCTTDKGKQCARGLPACSLLAPQARRAHEGVQDAMPRQARKT